MKSHLGNDDYFKPQSLYSNYGNFIKNNQTQSKQLLNSKNDNKSKNLTNTFNEHTQTLSKILFKTNT